MAQWGWGTHQLSSLKVTVFRVWTEEVQYLDWYFKHRYCTSSRENIQPQL